MLKVTRLFDCLALHKQSQQEVVLAGKIGGIYVPYSSQNLIDEVNKLSIGLYKKGIKGVNEDPVKSDKIGIISNSRPEWIITDLAVQQTGAILVPLYPNTNADEILNSFIESEVKYCFVNNKKNYDLMKSLQDQIPSLIDIYTFDEIENNAAAHWKNMQVPLDANDQKTVENDAEQFSEDHIATIIYTSGTTGKPKGVMLSHKNILSNLEGIRKVLDKIPLRRRVALSFLPLNHIYERVINYMYILYGFSTYYAQGVETIAANLVEVKPHLMVSVPRLFEKVYEKILAKKAELSKPKQLIFDWALKLADQYDPKGNGGLYNLQHKLADKLVYSKWREAVGGNLQAIVIGGAACSPKLARIFSAADMIIMEGYGMTETSPVIAVNHYDGQDRRLGTVGLPLDNVQIKIGEDGELKTKSDAVMKGYYKQPELTKEVFDEDGWFCTGDIVTLIENRFIKITDRKKELFKTTSGKYIAPQPIENKIKESRFIEQAMVIGDGEKFVSALIVPNFQYVKEWMQINNIPFTNKDEMLRLPDVKKKIKKEVDFFTKKFSQYEQVKKIIIVPEEWTSENGELTPKLSLKRNIIKKKYQDIIDKLYQKEEE